jgi:hypothetical protein
MSATEGTDADAGRRLEKRGVKLVRTWCFFLNVKVFVFSSVFMSEVEESDGNENAKRL